MAQGAAWDPEAFRQQMRNAAQLGTAVRVMDCLLGKEEHAPEIIRAFYEETLQSKPLEQHELISGIYRKIEAIGSGSFADVYLAWDILTREPVAVKVLRSGIGTPATLRRFRSEAAILRKLTQPGLCRVMSGPRGSGDEGGTHWIAMEFVAGRRLNQWRQDLMHAVEEDASAPPQDWRRVVRVFARLAETLGAVHSEKIVHRDLKPSNVIIAPGDRPVILDFGLGFDEEVASIGTNSYDVLGTLPYMSPEQLASSKDVNAQTDVWSLGVMLYEFLALERPFTGQGDHLVEQIARAPVPLLQNVRHDIPKTLSAVVECALERKLRLRYRDGNAFAADLLSVLAGQRPQAPVRGSLARTALQMRRNAKRVAIVSSIAVLALATGLFAWQSNNDAAEAAKGREAEALQTAKDALNRGTYLTPKRENIAATITALNVAAKQPETEKEAAKILASQHILLGEAQLALDILERHASVLKGSAADAIVRVDALRLLKREDEAVALEAALPACVDAADFDVSYRWKMRAYQKGLLKEAEVASMWNDAKEAQARATQPRLRYCAAALTAAASLKDVEGARRAAQVLTLHWGADTGVQYTIGTSLLRLGELAKAEAAFRRFVALEPKSWMGHTCLGIALFQQGSREQRLEAHEHYDTATQLAPDQAQAWFQLGMSHKGLGRFAQSIEPFDKSIALAPKSPDAFRGKAIALQEMQRDEDAIAVYKQVLQLTPADATAWFNIALLLRRSGQLDEALEAFAKNSALDAQSPLADQFSAEIHMERFHWAEALACFETSITKQPKQEQGWCGKSNMLLQLGRVEEALLAAQDGMQSEHAGETAELLCRKGLALMRLFRGAEAREALEIGHGLATRITGWAYPSEQWLQEALALERRELRMKELLAGAAHTDAPEECPGLAMLAMHHQRPLLASKLYQRVLETPFGATDPLMPGMAAGAMVLAALGRGSDCLDLSREERDALHLRAIATLQRVRTTGIALADLMPPAARTLIMDAEVRARLPEHVRRAWGQ